jgi:hypothetical protein
VVQMEQIRKVLGGSQLVFIVSGLGGTVGSGIAPLVAKCAKEVRAMVVGIITMPFVFEKHRHFFAGCALRQLTENSDGIIMLERTLGKEGELSAFDANAQLYEQLALTINSLIPPMEKDGVGTGVENVVDFIRANPYSVIRVGDESSPNYVSGETPNSSGILVSYQSREEVDEIISSFDPVDACLRRNGLHNLDPDLDSSFQFGQGVLKNLEA